MNEIFFYSVACDIVNESEDPEPRSVTKCQNRHDWTKWKDTIQAELNSLNKHKVFGSIILTPEAVRPVGYKWIFVRKRNEKNEIVRYKTRLVTQGFSQRPEIDYEETLFLFVHSGRGRQPTYMKRRRGGFLDIKVSRRSRSIYPSEDLSPYSKKVG